MTTSALPIILGVMGAAGRMGRHVAAAAEGRADMALKHALDRDADAQARAAALADCDVIIDFSSPAASTDFARDAARLGRPALIVGSTGFSQDQDRILLAQAEHIAIVKSGNFALGVNVLIGLVRQAARRLGDEWDIEILEAHHRDKIDAPSGTALMLGEAAAQGRGTSLSDTRLPAREGLRGARRRGGIGFASVRGGAVVGDHSVIFAGPDETLTLSHSALDRRLFAHGALTAAAWVVGRPAGLYDMMDVLGFHSA